MTLTATQREALDIMRRAELAGVHTHVSAHTDAVDFILNGPTAESLVRRGLAERHRAAHGVIMLTDAGRQAMAPPPITRRLATLSDDGLYRYTLTREWAAGTGHRRALFVMLNPSTADANVDDPTIRRCIGYARREGCDALDVVNLYAYRATDPRELDLARKARVDIVGRPANDIAIASFLDGAALIVAAWGAHKLAGMRQGEVMRLMAGREVFCLGRSNGGHPKHPLYLAGDATLERLHGIPPA